MKMPEDYPAFFISYNYLHASIIQIPMLPNHNPIETQAWSRLSENFLMMQAMHMRTLFAEDPKRFEKFSAKFEDILVD